jgi:catechol 2,3-dioxygenase-like lactoylglutathione lyase family enzyme
MATVKTGRLIDHLHLRVRDLEASRRFYKAALGALGIELDRDEPDHFVVDELYVDGADDYASRVHLAFQAADRAAVDRFHAACLAAGGRDNGAPGERDYHPGYYGAPSCSTLTAATSRRSSTARRFARPPTSRLRRRTKRRRRSHLVVPRGGCYFRFTATFCFFSSFSP